MRRREKDALANEAKVLDQLVMISTQRSILARIGSFTLCILITKRRLGVQGRLRAVGHAQPSKHLCIYGAEVIQIQRGPGHASFPPFYSDLR